MKRKIWFVFLMVMFLMVIVNIRKCNVFRELDNSFYEETFEGKVEMVIEGDRGLPIFIISGDSISLGGYGYNLNKHLSIGDCIFKYKGNSIVFICRSKEQDTIKVDVLDNSRYNIVP